MKFGEMNMADIDKYGRIIIGLVLIAAFFLNYLPSPWSWIGIIIGIIFIATGLWGSCPMYSLMGFSTKKIK